MGVSTNFCSVLFCWIQTPAMMLVFFPSCVVVKSPKQCTLATTKKNSLFLPTSTNDGSWILRKSQNHCSYNHICTVTPIFSYDGLVLWLGTPSLLTGQASMVCRLVRLVFCGAEATKNLQSMLRPIMTPMQPQRRGVLKTLQFWKGGFRKCFIEKGWKVSKDKNFSSWLRKHGSFRGGWEFQVFRLGEMFFFKCFMWSWWVWICPADLTNT